MPTHRSTGQSRPAQRSSVPSKISSTAIAWDRYAIHSATGGPSAPPSPDSIAPEYAKAAEQDGYELIEDQQLKQHDIGDLYYFSLPVHDLAKGRAFFGAVLGWQFPDPQPDELGAHIANISAPPGSLGKVAPEGSTRAQLWFVVDDIHAAVAKIRELGGSAEEPVLYDSGWSAECVDDQGTTFNLSVPAAKYTL